MLKEVDMKKILVAYFSHSGNTRDVANQIHKTVGGDLFEIQSVNPYPKDYDAVVEQAKKELHADVRPALKAKVGNISQYDVVFVGYPNWWYAVPRPVAAFLAGYDLAGKTIVPFCTHEGSGLSRTVSDIASLCPESTVLDGLAIRGKEAKTSHDKVSGWLQKINITK